MRTSTQTIAKLLAAFADAMETMDEHEFELLMRGEAKLRLVENEKGTGKKPAEDLRFDQSVSEVAQQLNDAESRESAEALIASINQPQRKKFLIALSRSCGVSVGSRDNIGRIEQKLIENVVGSKLRSQAIKKVAF